MAAGDLGAEEAAEGGVGDAGAGRVVAVEVRGVAGGRVEQVQRCGGGSERSARGLG